MCRRLGEDSSLCLAYPGAAAVQAQEGGSYLCPGPHSHQGAGRPGTAVLPLLLAPGVGAAS